MQGKEHWSKVVDLMVTTYRTTDLAVYYKPGDANPYEETPCAWKKVAEVSGWNGGSWKKVYPPWVNGFEPVVIPPNEKASFYVVNMGDSYGILGKSGVAKYTSPVVTLDAGSPLGAMSMSGGSQGYNDKPFKPYPYYYGGYRIR